MSSINFVIGNTYTKISDSCAALDRTGFYRKVHDWILYVDVLLAVDDDDDAADLIRKVEFNLGCTFDPSTTMRFLLASLALVAPHASAFVAPPPRSSSSRWSHSRAGPTTTT